MEIKENRVFLSNEDLKILFKQFNITNDNKHLYLVNFKKNNWNKINNKQYDFAIIDLTNAKTYGVISSDILPLLKQGASWLFLEAK